MPVTMPVPSSDGDPLNAAGARVADGMAEVLLQGPDAMTQRARSFNSEEIRRGLAFLATVLEVASMSSRHLAEVLVERGGGEGEEGKWN
jgi:hypothetical protein